MIPLAAIGIAYLLGAIPFGYLLVRLKSGGDIRAFVATQRPEVTAFFLIPWNDLVTGPNHPNQNPAARRPNAQMTPNSIFPSLM